MLPKGVHHVAEGNTFAPRKPFNAFSLKQKAKEKALQRRTDGTFRNIKIIIYSVPSPNIPRGFTSAFRQSGNGIFTTLGTYCTGAFRRLRAATRVTTLDLSNFLKKV